MSILDFEYEFGKENRKLQKKVTAWKERREYSGYVIVGPSCSGKTLLLKKLAAEIEKTEYMAGYEVVERLGAELMTSNRNPVIAKEESSECLLIDHFDELNGMRATMNEICRMLKEDEWNKDGNKRLIICTFVNEALAETFAVLMGYEILRCNHVKPNLRSVRENAKKFGISLTEGQIRSYADCDTMFALRQAFREREKEEFRKRVIISA